MAKNTDKYKELAWMDVDVPGLKGPILNAYNEYKKAQKAAAERRDEFETAFLAEARKKKSIEDGETLRFSHRFGKLAVAKDVADSPKAAKGGMFKL